MVTAAGYQEVTDVRGSQKLPQATPAMNHYASEMRSGSSGSNEELDSKPAASTTPGTERPSSSITLEPPRRRTKGSDSHQHEEKEAPTAPPPQASRGLESLPSSPRRETSSTKLIHNGESLSPTAAAEAKNQKKKRNPDKFTALNRSNARDSVFNPDRVIFPNPLSPRQSYPYDSLPLSKTRNQEPSIATAMNLNGILPTEQVSSLATNASAQELLMLQDQLDRNRQLAQWMLQLRCKNAAAATDMLVGPTAGVLPYSFPTTSPYSQLPQTTLPTDDLLRLLLQPRLQPSLTQVDFLSRSAVILKELVKQTRPPQWQEQQLLQLQLQREQLQPPQLREQLQVREQLLLQLREQQQRQLPQLQLQQHLQLPQLQQEQLRKRLRHLSNSGQDNDQPSPSQKKKQRSDQRKDREEKMPTMEECSNEAKTGEIELPPCIDSDVIPPMASRRIFPLGIEEDANWLSEFHCFLREEIIEVFQASHHDVKARNNSIVLKQIGLRCRCCAHRTGISCKPGRSSAFPSSIDQIYQSFTMMLRDHFSNCDAIHKGEMGERYTLLKDRSSQGAIDSKRYWAYAGLKIGMIDAKSGIFMNKESRLEGLTSLPFGVDPKTRWRDGDYTDVSLVVPSDRENIPEFLYLLLSQAQPIRLTKGECIGSRRNLRVGLAGFGCRHCCRQQRMGLCRVFPARRKTLPTKTFALYDHIRRCPLCPASLKAALVAGKQQYDDKIRTDQDGHRRYYDSLWERIGNCSSSKKQI